MTDARFSLDVGRVASITGAVSGELDVLSGRVTAALGGISAALAAVAAESSVSGALESVARPRRTTGPGMVDRGGEVLAAAQTAALGYLAADNDMASMTLGAEASTDVDSFSLWGKR